MKNHMDCIMTGRHPIAHHRVWQPWYIGGEDGKKTSSAPGSPVDLRDSPSKELPTRSHKLKRSKERRELDYSLCKDKSKKCIPEELNSLNGALKESREESNSSEVDQLASDGGEEDDDDPETYDDDMDGHDYDNLSPNRMITGMRHEGRLLVMRAEPLMTVVDDDAPLDMTTSNRSRSRDTSSPSPSPPLSLAPVVITPPFCSNPPLLYSPYASSAPPPPYHPLHYHPSPHRQIHSPRSHRSSPTSPPPSYLTATLANAVGPPATTVSTVLQQHNRPSVITCASALRTSVSPSAVHLGPSPATLMVTPSRGATGLMRSHSSITATCNGSAASRRSFSDPTPLTAPASLTSKSRKGSEVKPGHRREIRSGMCDPVIDEHFRRSLGKDYPEYLSTSSPSSSSSPPPVPSTALHASGSTAVPGNQAAVAHSAETTSSSSISITGMSVDDHFAKALGETWLRIQGKLTSSSTRSPSSPVSPSSSSSGTTSPTTSSNSSSSVKMTSTPPSPLHQRHSGMIST